MLHQEKILEKSRIFLFAVFTSVQIITYGIT